MTIRYVEQPGESGPRVRTDTCPICGAVRAERKTGPPAPTFRQFAYHIESEHDWDDVR